METVLPACSAYLHVQGRVGTPRLLRIEGALVASCPNDWSRTDKGWRQVARRGARRRIELLSFPAGASAQGERHRIAPVTRQDRTSHDRWAMSVDHADQNFVYQMPGCPKESQQARHTQVSEQPNRTRRYMSGEHPPPKKAEISTLRQQRVSSATWRPSPHGSRS
jgi:hypothetical protein